MRIFFLSMSLLLLSVVLHGQKWEVESLGVPIKMELYGQTGSIIGLDSTSYIIASTVASDSLAYSFIIETNDFGENWDTLFVERASEGNPLYEIVDIKCKGDTILLLFNNQFIKKSTNNGETWEERRWQEKSYWPKSNRLEYRNDILTFNSRIHFNELQLDTIVYSTDFGDTWNYVHVEGEDTSGEQIRGKSIGCPYIMGDTIIIHKRHDCATFKYGNETEGNLQFLKSTDMGENWEEFAFIKYNEIEDYEFGNDGKIYTIASYRYIKDSLIMGNSKIYTPDWNSNFLRIDPISGKVDTLFQFVEADLEKCEDLILFEDKIIARFWNKIYVSDDGGNSWIAEKAPLGAEEFNFGIQSMARPRFERGMLIGYTSSDCKIGKIEYPVSVNESRYYIEDFTAYPNPVASGNTVNLEFDARESGMYSYKMNSMIGSEFDLGSSEYHSVGRVSIALPIRSDLANGSYIISVLKDGEVVAAKKIIIE